MSSVRQPAQTTPPTGLTVDLPAGGGIEWHAHRHHQLALAAQGTLLMAAGDRAWVLPRSRALWMPAGITHSVNANGATRMLNLYIHPDRCPLTWTSPTMVTAGGLFGELVFYLLKDDLDEQQRCRAEAVLWDLMDPLSVTALSAPIPTDQRARQVAEALLSDVTDGRTLAAWGREVGASARTLARLFADQTGMGFESWRTNARLAVAIPLLAAGTPVATVARQVGYSTPSAFVAAFRREIGTTPTQYFRDA